MLADVVQLGSGNHVKTFYTKYDLKTVCVIHVAVETCSEVLAKGSFLAVGKAVLKILSFISWVTVEDIHTVSSFQNSCYSTDLCCRRHSLMMPSLTPNDICMSDDFSIEC